MNARQKAKLYKRQLKQLTVPVNEVYINRTQLKHYKLDIQIPYKSDIPNKDVAMKIAYNKIINEIESIIYNNIVEKTDVSYIFKDTYNYEFDIWTKN